MQKTSIFIKLLPPALGAAGLAAWLGFMSCSTKEAPPRAIRGHTRLIQGIAHGEPAAKAERYCAYCHGRNLQGGAHFEPSCYACHGRNWLDASFEAALAPSDHTVINKNFHHKPGLFTPLAGCVACHGASLEGNTANGLTYPGCELCHAKLWEERTPPPGGG